MSEKVKVNDQPQQFYLAGKSWVPAVGHEVEVGKHRFCVVPLEHEISVSEVTSGVKIFGIKNTLSTYIQTETKEDALNFIEGVGVSLIDIVEKDGFDSQINRMKEDVINKLGEQPPIEEVTVDE